MRFLLLFTVLSLVTYGQLVIKLGAATLGPVPMHNTRELFLYMLQAFTNLYILSGFFAAFLAAIAWLATVSRFDLSSTYPYLSLNFILVPFLAILFFGEEFNWSKAIGCVIIVAGVFVFSRGA